MEIARKLKSNLQDKFDFFDDYVVGGITFPLYGKYYMRNSRYFATKKVEIYAFTVFEHLLYYKVNGVLDDEIFNNIDSTVYDNLSTIVQPNDEHMSSVITMIVECDGIEGELETRIKKFKRKKTFKFGLNGWVDVKVMVIVGGEKRAVENKLAKGDAERLQLLC